jgi:hypothetical protein
MASFHFSWLVLIWAIIGHPDNIQGQSAVITGPVIGEIFNNIKICLLYRREKSYVNVTQES